MSFINNRSPREDTTFFTRVKDALIRHHGSGGIVQALLAFKARHQRAISVNGYPSNSPGVVLQPRGLNYPEFIAYLRSQGIELRDSEGQYLCQAFDDDNSGYISPKTYIRHLLGLTVRRMSAVDKAWYKLCSMYEEQEQDPEVMARWREGGRQTLPENAVLGPYCTCPLQIPQSVCFSSPCGEAPQGNTDVPHLLPALARRGENIRTFFCNPANRSQRQKAGLAPDQISFEEFLAYAAALSRRVRTEEDFQKMILRLWDADTPQAPLLNETDRDWGDDVDPLAVYSPLYVKDCLRIRECNNPHYDFELQRQWRKGIILPQLNRPHLMQSTQHHDYKPYDTIADLALADPLFNRRWQLF